MEKRKKQSTTYMAAGHRLESLEKVTAILDILIIISVPIEQGTYSFVWCNTRNQR